MVRQALSACNDRTNSWIVDSGATCHMCNSGVVMSNFHSLKKPQEVTLGDGHVLEATGHAWYSGIGDNFAGREDNEVRAT